MAQQVVTNPASSNEGSGMGMMIGIIILVVVILLLIFFGLPYLRGTNQAITPTQNTNEVTVPQEQPGTQINVPDQLDVNVQPNQ
jgi:hypothetical protein